MTVGVDSLELEPVFIERIFNKVSALNLNPALRMVLRQQEDRLDLDELWTMAAP